MVLIISSTLMTCLKVKAWVTVTSRNGRFREPKLKFPCCAIDHKLRDVMGSLKEHWYFRHVQFFQLMIILNAKTTASIFFTFNTKQILYKANRHAKFQLNISHIVVDSAHNIWRFKVIFSVLAFLMPKYNLQSTHKIYTKKTHKNRFAQTLKSDLRLQNNAWKMRENTLAKLCQSRRPASTW